MYQGDIRLGDTIDIKFTTRRFTTGAPFTLAGTPAVSAYVGNGTTEITAGITLTVDFDSRTGLNNVRVVATSGNGFATATNVQLVLTAGTVDSVSVVGEVVGTFSIEARAALMPTTVGRTLDVTAANKVNGVVLVDTVTAYTGNTPQTGDVYALVGAPAGASVSADLAAVKTDTGTLVTRITSALFSGITSLAQWLGLMAGQQAGNSTARTELRATGAGSGTFDETADSQEAIRDRGDAAWVDSGTPPAAAAIASQVRMELTTELGRLDVATSTRLATAGYTTPPAAATVAAAVRSELALELGRVDEATSAAKTLTSAERISVADALLKRDLSAITGEADRSPINAMRFNRNRFTIVAGVLTVYCEDDVTVAWTATITQTAGNPVSASDPA